MNQQLSLCAFLGNELEDALYFKTFFEHREIFSGYSYHELDSIITEAPSGFYCQVICPEAGGFYMDGEELEETLVKMSDEVLEIIKRAPFFYFAILGVNSKELIPLSEILNENVQLENLEGLIVHQQVYDRMPSKNLFVPFAGEYLWIPFRAGKTIAQAG